MSGPYSIAFVERSTGIGRETLRIWERRYGFPSPRRDASGDRSYSSEELDHLRVIKRLLDQGYRPGRVVKMTNAELAALAPGESATGGGALSDAHAEFLDLLNRAEPAETQDWLRRRLAAEGLAGFVLNTLTPLADAVGDAWAPPHRAADPRPARGTARQVRDLGGWPHHHASARHRGCALQPEAGRCRQVADALA